MEGLDKNDPNDFRVATGKLDPTYPTTEQPVSDVRTHVGKIERTTQLPGPRQDEHQEPSVYALAVPDNLRITDMNEYERSDDDEQILELQTRITKLELALEIAHADPAYSALTRAGIDHRWHQRPAVADTVIFFDIDNIHDHNERWGYEGTDARIRTVMSQIETFWIFRWYSGDEFGLICAAPDALGFAARVKRLLQEEGMTATFGIAPITDNHLEASMARAAALVQDAKARGVRGAIYEE